MLHLSLFGHLSVARYDVDGLSKAIDISGRPGSLFAYLALSKGRFFTRSELISALWSEQSSEPISTGTFNTTLWRLRKTLEKPPLAQSKIVQCDRRGAIGLPQDAELELDVSEFTRLITPCLHKPIEQLNNNDIDNLRRGVNLYRDDILTGFSDDWALREREMHRRMLLNALARLMQTSIRLQDLGSAIRYAQEILDRDPLREDIHRELMQLFIANGQRAMALRQFELCRAALRKELAIQPMRETLAVYQQIANNAVGRSPESTGQAPAHSLTRRTPPDGEPSTVPGDSTHTNQFTHSLSELITNALHHLAQADAQLQLALPLFDDLSRLRL